MKELIKDLEEHVKVLTDVSTLKTTTDEECGFRKAEKNELELLKNMLKRFYKRNDKEVSDGEKIYY